MAGEFDEADVKAIDTTLGTTASDTSYDGGAGAANGSTGNGEDGGAPPPQPNPATPLGQLMAVKVGIGADNSLPKDMFGRPIYNSIVGPYGAVERPNEPQTGSCVPGPLDRFDRENNFVPLLPDGVNISQNVDEAHQNGGIYWLYQNERNKGPWDFKQQNKDYADGGNFHYGIIAEAAGIPDWLIMRAPGVAQIRAGTSKEEYGKPWGSPPYGDDPNDQYWIQKGRDYYNSHYRQAGENVGWRKNMDRVLGKGD